MGEVEGSGLGGLLAHTRGGGISWPTPGRVARLTPGGDLWAHTQGGIPACTEVDPPADGYCCGRHVSYWNAFLLVFFVELLVPLS